jgi:hypothetical protein
MNDIEISTIAKGDDELRIAVKEFKGRVYTDVRIFVDYQAGGKGPSKKGITVGPTKIRSLIEALEQAAAKMDSLKAERAAKEAAA